MPAQTLASRSETVFPTTPKTRLEGTREPGLCSGWTSLALSELLDQRRRCNGSSCRAAYTRLGDGTAQTDLCSPSALSRLYIQGPRFLQDFHVQRGLPHAEGMLAPLTGRRM